MVLVGTRVGDVVGGGGRVEVTVGAATVAVSVSVGGAALVGVHGRVGRRVGVSSSGAGASAVAAGGAAPCSGGWAKAAEAL